MYCLAVCNLFYPRLPHPTRPITYARPNLIVPVQLAENHHSALLPSKLSASALPFLAAAGKVPGFAFSLLYACVDHGLRLVQSSRYRVYLPYLARCGGSRWILFCECTTVARMHDL